jgi:hypothetical protein
MPGSQDILVYPGLYSVASPDNLDEAVDLVERPLCEGDASIMSNQFGSLGGCCEHRRRNAGVKSPFFRDIDSEALIAFDRSYWGKVSVPSGLDHEETRAEDGMKQWDHNVFPFA